MLPPYTHPCRPPGAPRGRPRGALQPRPPHACCARIVCGQRAAARDAHLFPHRSRLCRPALVRGAACISRSVLIRRRRAAGRRSGGSASVWPCVAPPACLPSWAQVLALYSVGSHHRCRERRAPPAEVGALGAARPWPCSCCSLPCCAARRLLPDQRPPPLACSLLTFPNPCSKRGVTVPRWLANVLFLTLRECRSGCLCIGRRCRCLPAVDCRRPCCLPTTPHRSQCTSCWARSGCRP